MAATPPRPLAKSDDRDAFDCGREALNGWFRRHAWSNQHNDSSRVSVIADRDSGRIVGFVAMSAAQIERALLPKSLQRNQPGAVPVILLGQLAIDRRHQGLGHGADLLRFALEAAVHVSNSVGALGVITHPLDDALREFYARAGFQDLPFDPQRAMLVRMTDVRASIERRDAPRA